MADRRLTLALLVILGLVSRGLALQCYRCEGLHVMMDNPAAQAGADAVTADEKYHAACLMGEKEFPMNGAPLLVDCPAKPGMIPICTFLNASFTGTWGGESGHGVYIHRDCGYKEMKDVEDDEDFIGCDDDYADKMEKDPAWTSTKARGCACNGMMGCNGIPVHMDKKAKLMCYMCEGVEFHMENPEIQRHMDEWVRVNGSQYDKRCLPDNMEMEHELMTFCPEGLNGEMPVCEYMKINFDGVWEGNAGKGSWVGRSCGHKTNEWEVGCDKDMTIPKEYIEKEWTSHKAEGCACNVASGCNGMENMQGEKGLQCYECHGIDLMMENPEAQPYADALVMQSGQYYDPSCVSSPMRTTFCPHHFGEMAACTSMNVSFSGTYDGERARGKYVARGCGLFEKKSFHDSCDPNFREYVPQEPEWDPNYSAVGCACRGERCNDNRRRDDHAGPMPPMTGAGAAPAGLAGLTVAALIASWC